jgi:O-antigen/teichoic acid export membrane protein
VPLDQFGYYALAWVMAGGLALAIMPAHNTLFPQFSALFGDERLREAFHRGAQMLSALLLPLACVVAFFAAPILRIWTADASIAARTAPIATALVVGMAINGLMHPPYALQLASGSTRLPLILTLGQLAFIVPAVALLTLRLGLVGASYAWPAMNALYFLVGSVWTFRLLLPGAWGTWIARDIGLPLAAALVPVVLAWRFVALPEGRVAGAVSVGIVFACSLLAAQLAVPSASRKL